MKARPLIVIMYFACFFLLLEIETVSVRTDKKELIYLTFVKDGSVIELSHINSIYDAPVNEILMVNDSHFELVSVSTPSFGVKEYYLMDDLPKKRRYEAIRFFNSKERNFSLKIKGKNLDLKNYVERSIELKVCQIKVFDFLFLFFRQKRMELTF